MDLPPVAYMSDEDVLARWLHSNGPGAAAPSPAGTPARPSNALLQPADDLQGIVTLKDLYCDETLMFGAASCIGGSPLLRTPRAIKLFATPAPSRLLPLDEISPDLLQALQAMHTPPNSSFTKGLPYSPPAAHHLLVTPARDLPIAGVDTGVLLSKAQELAGLGITIENGMVRLRQPKLDAVKLMEVYTVMKQMGAPFKIEYRTANKLTGLEGSCDLPIPASTCLLRCFEPKDGKIEKRRGHRNNTLHVPVMIGPEHLRLSSILSFVLGDDAESVKAWRFCIQDVMDALDSKHTRTVITARQDASEADIDRHRYEVGAWEGTGHNRPRVWVTRSMAGIAVFLLEKQLWEQKHAYLHAWDHNLVELYFEDIGQPKIQVPGKVYMSVERADALNTFQGLMPLHRVRLWIFTTWVATHSPGRFGAHSEQGTFRNPRIIDESDADPWAPKGIGFESVDDGSGTWSGMSAYQDEFLRRNDMQKVPGPTENPMAKSFAEWMKKFEYAQQEMKELEEEMTVALGNKMFMGFDGL